VQFLFTITTVYLAMENGALEQISYSVAKKILDITKEIQVKKHEYVLSKQLLRSGTSIMANIQEAGAAQTRKDFILKLSITRKEVRETIKWIELLTYGQYISPTVALRVQLQLTSIFKLLNASIGTAKKICEILLINYTENKIAKAAQDVNTLMHQLINLILSSSLRIPHCFCSSSCVQ